MKINKLGWTDLNLSGVGLGTWATGGGNWQYSWGPQDDNESINTIKAAIDGGINWIDTAPVYGLGHSEEVVGRAVKGLKDRPLIATKCGRVWDSDRGISGDLRKKSVIAEAEASLRRLKSDVIDLYQIHHPEGNGSIEEAWEAIAELVKKGKVRYAGVSNFSVEQMKRVQAIHPIASIQPPYNMIRRGIEEEILSYCSANNIGVIVYGPMERGLLTGKFSRERVKNLPADDHRGRDTFFQGSEFEANIELAFGLRSIAEKKGMTPAQMAVAWVLRRSEVTAAIVGARSVSQIEETVLAGGMDISEEDIAGIEKLLDRRKKKLDKNSNGGG